MVLDLAGVPVRVRSHLARLRPEQKAALRRVASSLRSDATPPVVDEAADAWLVERLGGVRGEILEVGPHGVAARVLGRPVTVLDPWGRAGARYVGAVGPVLGADRFDAVVVPRMGADDPTTPEPEVAVGRLLDALVPGGTLVAVVAGPLDRSALRAAVERSAVGGEVGPIAGSAAVGVRAVRA